MAITQGATAEGMIARYGITCFPPLTSPLANDSVEQLFAPTSRPSVVSHRVGPAPAFNNTYESDNFGVPLGFPTSPQQFRFYGGYTAGTHDTIIQQDANRSTRGHPGTSDINVILNGHLEESMQPTVSEPDPQIGPATKPAAKPASPRFSKTCKWEGCQYPRPFGREADLVRHLKTIHINPGAYICPELGCGKPCSRKDNLEAHRQRVHGRGN
jgi:hypothetical protein